jgi:hypothetical protein
MSDVSFTNKRICRLVDFFKKYVRLFLIISNNIYKSRINELIEYISNVIITRILPQRNRSDEVESFVLAITQFMCYTSPIELTLTLIQ